jgi:hypothetical protein
MSVKSFVKRPFIIPGFIVFAMVFTFADGFGLQTKAKSNPQASTPALIMLSPGAATTVNDTTDSIHSN